MDTTIVNDLLRDLATQLGTTAEYLWEVLLSQAAVQVQILHVWLTCLIVMGCISAAFLIIITVVGFIQNDFETCLSAFGYTFGGLALIGFILAAVGVYTSIITCTQNPEFWALQQVLNTIAISQ